MTRFMLLVICVLTCALLAVPVRADDPPKMLTPDERKELVAKLIELNAAGVKAHQVGNSAEAVKALEDALQVARQLYPKSDFPDGHNNLAGSLNNLASLYQVQGKQGDAEPLFRDALDMYRRLFKGDHPSVATSLNNLAMLYKDQGKLGDAEPLLKDTLEMHKRLFKGDIAAGKGIKGFDGLVELGWVKQVEDNGSLIDDYMTALRDDKSVLVVAPTHAEGEEVTAGIRTRLKEQGVIHGEERTIDQLKPLHWTEAERGDLERYDGTEVMVFHRNSGTFKAGQ